MLYNRSLSHTIVVIGVVVGVPLLGVRTMADEGDLPSDAIRASELCHKVSVIGKLGFPLGKVVTLRGKWRLTKSESEKWQSGHFEVSEINGKRLETPVSFLGLSADVDDEGFTPWDGDYWELRGYETGGFFGIPNEALVEIGSPLWPSVKYGFSSYFAYYRASRVSELNDKQQSVSPSPVPMATAQAQEPSPSQTVKASEILRQVPIIGRLNRPMGTIIAIRGRWHKTGDRYGPFFRVSHIEGKKVADPVDYKILNWPVAIGNLKALKSANITDGDVWELRGFEEGYLQGLPAEASRERGTTNYDFPGGTFPFTVNFCYFKARRFRVPDQRVFTTEEKENDFPQNSGTNGVE